MPTLMIKAHLTTTIWAPSPVDKKNWLILFLLLLVIGFVTMQPVEANGISFDAPANFSEVVSQNLEADNSVDCHGSYWPDNCTSSHCAAPIPVSLLPTVDPINTGLNAIVQLDFHDFLSSPLRQPPK